MILAVGLSLVMLSFGGGITKDRAPAATYVDRILRGDKPGEVEYLPKYSPDLNPIELSFSKFKAHLRKLSEQTIPALHGGVASFIPTLSRAECRNYFRRAGYVSFLPESAVVTAAAT